MPARGRWSLKLSCGHHLTIPLRASHGAQQTAIFLLGHSRVAPSVAVSGEQGELVWQLFSQPLERVKPVRALDGPGVRAVGGEQVRGYRCACNMRAPCCVLNSERERMNVCQRVCSGSCVGMHAYASQTRAYRYTRVVAALPACIYMLEGGR